jgi:hypothetical protein
LEWATKEKQWTQWATEASSSMSGLLVFCVNCTRAIMAAETGPKKDDLTTSKPFKKMTNNQPSEDCTTT